MRNGAVPLLAVVAMLAFGGPAVAQTLDEQQKTCQSPNFDLRIDACTAAIRSGQLQGEPLAVALGNRGIAYAGKGQLDRAIQDFNDALVVKPGFAAVLVRRGAIYRHQGNMDRAMADFEEAVRVAPKFADGYDDRGGIYAERGQYDRALADFNTAIQLNPKSASAYFI